MSVTLHEMHHRSGAPAAFLGEWRMRRAVEGIVAAAHRHALSRDKCWHQRNSASRSYLSARLKCYGAINACGAGT